ncbi:MAG: phosphatase PAP2 family protein [Gemmatimonadaceae bacterium]|nr:phosphatase PAP2 family protein [Gloeobacterales cyanobacterium ES-bin-141]
MTRGDGQLPHRLRRGFAWLERRGFGPVLTTLPIVGLGFAALTLWGFSKLASEVLEQETEAFDATILYALRTLHTPALDLLAKGVTFLGEPALLIAVTVLIGVILLVQRQVAEGIALPISALGATGLNYLLKSVFARARPQLWERSVEVNFYSFPSGHATGALVIYGFIGYLLAVRVRPGRRGLIIFPTTLLILAIGLSRLYLGVHWPTDVIGGYMAGSVWLIACILTLRLWQAKHQD